jgi:hypothetical protein
MFLNLLLDLIRLILVQLSDYLISDLEKRLRFLTLRNFIQMFSPSFFDFRLQFGIIKFVLVRLPGVWKLGRVA